jgi:hypothetical protein
MQPPASQVLCTDQLPTWAPALSAGGPEPGSASGGAALLPSALAGAAAALLSVHAQLPELEDPYPLLSEGVCGAAGQLAAALQHVAAAPGLCIGPGGPALRAAATAQCVRLRDAFMPGG